MHLQTSRVRSAPRRRDESGALRAGQTRTVDTVVFALIPEFEQAKVRDSEGHVYALTRETRGVDVGALHEGQRVVCTVTRKLPRVLSAEAIA
jgi:hypothetical protein